MSHDLTLREIKKEWHGSLRNYLVGFAICLVLTAASFALVAAGLLPQQHTIYTIAALAVVQAVVQLLCFLHVGQEAKPRWETLILCFMVLILLIIAIGSLWIMHDLNNRVMSDMHSQMAKEGMTHD
jgi:cytochrome o ubiquinol oxidase subunit IV